MRADGLRSALEHLCLADGGGLSDGQLLGRFIDGREGAAFAALVRRHGPMVLGVCRRVLGNVHDADDAFQAAFLILARKAASVVKREAVASFLYGVAYRTAVRARVRALRRRAIERQVEDMPDPEVPPAEAQDWRPVLDRELSRLPEKYRAPLVLCDLECKTRREAARQLGLVEGTLASRLATARRMLARRLVRCGVTLSGGALAVALAEGAASAAVPPGLVVTTVKAAASVAAGRTAGLATPAAVLMNEVLRAMLMTKLKVYVAAAVVAVMLGVGGLAFRAAGQAPPGRGKPMTDLELLRHEVDILKLEVEVLQEKVRAQGEELRTLKGQPGKGAAPPRNRFSAPPAQPPADVRPGTFPALPNQPALAPVVPPPPDPPGTVAPPALPAPPEPPADLRPPDNTEPARVGEPALAAHGPEQEAEAAVKALRAAGNDERARRKAVQALERALRRLKDQEGPAGDTP
jgi:RNA polymerase sigma factor (sigma-70 family)